MRLITYVCDRVGCEEEESIRSKDPAPAGWGELAFSKRVDGKTVQLPPSVLCPQHFQEFQALLVAPEIER